MDGWLAVAVARACLTRVDVGPVHDGGRYNLARMWLDAGELIEFGRELLTVAKRRLANAPTPGRKRRILAAVVLPSGDSTPQTARCVTCQAAA